MTPMSSQPERVSWWHRLKSGLSRSNQKINTGLRTLFVKRRLDAAALEELEELLITSDIGVSTSAKIVAELAQEKFEKDITSEEIRDFLCRKIQTILEPCAIPLTIPEQDKPFVMLVVGVNGVGKTTTIGKLGHLLQQQGHTPHLVAGDTFRAAAVEQLTVWADRLGAAISTTIPEGDAAALVIDAWEQAQSDSAPKVLMIDTAGRLHNKTHLMAELEKIVRVLRKKDATAPHATILVLDATTGQNALVQLEEFQKTVGISGIVMTKLDGTARGGIVVALADRYAKPIHAIGIGEGLTDLRPFTAQDFAHTLVGTDT